MLLLIFVLMLPCHGAEGLILPGEASPLCPELGAALTRIGLWDGSRAEILDTVLLEAINVFRRCEGLPQPDYCDPITLRRLGIECEDSDTILLAAFAEWISPDGSETDRAMLSLQTAERARSDGVRLFSLISSLCDIAKLGTYPSASSLHGAVIARLVSQRAASPPCGR